MLLLSMSKILASFQISYDPLHRHVELVLIFLDESLCQLAEKISVILQNLHGFLVDFSFECSVLPMALAIGTK
jgi:hypothetical protein